MLTSKQRAFLRSKAAAIDTTFQIGKGGVNENMLISIEAALAAHEMVKIKCLENCEYTPREACDGICGAIEADGVQVIGNKFVLFKISPEHRQYDLDKLTVIEEKKEQPKKKTNAPLKKSGTPAKKTGTPAKKTGTPAKKTGASAKRSNYTVIKKK